jgi:uncharacterized membrane protein AbrB (regulator of aidB expression)
MNEPFGLPTGTVRGVIALAFTVVSLYLFATGQPVPEALLAVNTLIVGNYFGARSTASAVAALQAPTEPLAAPYIPNEQGD